MLLKLLLAKGSSSEKNVGAFFTSAAITCGSPFLSTIREISCESASFNFAFTSEDTFARSSSKIREVIVFPSMYFSF